MTQCSEFNQNQGSHKRETTISQKTPTVWHNQTIELHSVVYNIEFNLYRFEDSSDFSKDFSYIGYRAENQCTYTTSTCTVSYRTCRRMSNAVNAPYNIVNYLVLGWRVSIRWHVVLKISNNERLAPKQLPEQNIRRLYLYYMLLRNARLFKQI